MSNLKTVLDVLTETNVKHVTTAELSDILANTVIINQMATFASVIQLTEPRCTKKDRKTKEPFNGLVQKLSQVSIILNSQYEKNVTNQLTRENKSESDYKKGVNTMPLTKGENNNFFGTFYDKPVIEYRPNTQNFPTTFFFLNGSRVEKTDLPDVLPTTNKATNQGTDKEVFWRKLYVKNIVQITLNGVTYQTI